MSDTLQLPRGTDTIQPQSDLYVEDLREHFPIIGDQLDFYERNLGILAVYVRADLNEAGCYKWRGAEEAIRVEKLLGTRLFVAASAGNHAWGVVRAMRQPGREHLKARIILPNSAPAPKKEALIAAAPANVSVVVYGDSFDEAQAYAFRTQAEGEVYIPPFDSVTVINGQQTLYDETFEIMPDVTDFIVPMGGGGLFAGGYLAIEKAHSSARIHGIEASGSNSASRTFNANSATPLEAWAPNELFGGAQVKYTGQHVLDTVRRVKPHERPSIHTVYNEEVRWLAQNHIDRPGSTPTPEPTAYLAVAGLIKLFRLGLLDEDARVAVIGTGHNAPLDDLLKQPVRSSLTVGGRIKHS